MSLWTRIKESLRRSSERKDQAAIQQAELERDRRHGEEGLPPHTEEVIQPRQYPPSDSGVNF